MTRALDQGHAQGAFTILHLICHGQQSTSQGPALYLGDDLLPDLPTFVTGPQFIEALSQRLHAPPQLIFLASCESAVADPGIDGLAQTLVRSLAVPNVIAMAAKLSVTGAATLAQAFYARLRSHGEADRALNEARRELTGKSDAQAPVCFTCTPGRPIFATTLDHPLAPAEISAGLARFAAEIVRRAPVLKSDFARAKQVLQTYSGMLPSSLAATERVRYDEALRQLETLSNEVFGLSFAAVARDEPLPAYPDSEAGNPFPGMRAFQPDQGERFFGRDEVIATQVPRLYQALMRGEAPILSIVGASGAGEVALAEAALRPGSTKRVDSGTELRMWVQAYRYVPELSCYERTLYRLVTLRRG